MILFRIAANYRNYSMMVFLVSVAPRFSWIPLEFSLPGNHRSFPLGWQHPWVTHCLVVLLCFSQKFQNIPFRAHSSKAVPPHAGVVSLKYFVWVNLKYFVYVIFIYFQNVSLSIFHKYPEIWAGIRYFFWDVWRPAHVLVGTILTAVQVLPKGEHHPCTFTFTIEMF